MEIINAKEFLKLPNGTLYRKYAPQHFEDLYIKRDSIVGDGDELIDFYFQNFTTGVDSIDSNEQSDILFEAENDGIDVRIDFNTVGRDGMFDMDQLYAVYERYEIREIIYALTALLNNGDA